MGVILCVSSLEAYSQNSGNGKQSPLLVLKAGELSLVLSVFGKKLDIRCCPLCVHAGGSRKEVTEHWEWLEQNLLQTLSIFENENDVTTFVRGKIQVIVFSFCFG